jgi:hypothetical protein
MAGIYPIRINETLKDLLKLVIEKNDMWIKITPYIGTIREVVNSQSINIEVALPTYEFKLSDNNKKLSDIKMIYDINTYPPKSLRGLQMGLEHTHYVYMYETEEYLTTKEILVFRDKIPPYLSQPFDSMLYFDYEIDPGYILLKFPV